MLLSPVLKKRGIVIASRITIIGCKWEWVNTESVLNWTNGKRQKTTQKTIKTSIADGFGLIRCFKNMLPAKK